MLACSFESRAGDGLDGFIDVFASGVVAGEPAGDGTSCSLGQLFRPWSVSRWKVASNDSASALSALLRMALMTGGHWLQISLSTRPPDRVMVVVS